MKDYSYSGFRPYGAGEMFILDSYIEDNFDGTVVTQIMKYCKAKFVITENINYNGNLLQTVKEAYLELPNGMKLKFVEE